MTLLCPKCAKERDYRIWCQECAIKYFVSNYERWTSGDQIVDQVIKYTQENSKSPVDFVEWIPYEQLEKRETIEFRNCENTSLSQNIQYITQEIELVIKRNTAPKPPPSSKVVEHSSGKDSSYTTIGQIQT
ncbi:kinase-like protein [Gigaspora margarita]|uniref:Kinase-like protein n=1 Tax=Gigaspora margarita TaxID=4874 RepID=A0A8H3WYQ2_GIGMA|nr:kinase-like protein [Gigaspora margarita]